MKHCRSLLLSILIPLMASACSTPRSTPVASDTAKAEKKIAFALGQEPGTFTITSQSAGEAPGGTIRTDYIVSTAKGARYACYIMEPSGFGKVMSWGMASGSDAVCNATSSGGKPAPKSNNAGCNDLLRAAGKCS